jgi:hypothetical protein
LNDFGGNTKARDQLGGLDKQVEVKLARVVFAYAVVDPRTVVVMSGDTLVAVFAVLATQRHFYVAHAAEFLLNKQDHVVFVSGIGLSWDLVVLRFSLDVFDNHWQFTWTFVVLIAIVLAVLFNGQEDIVWIQLRVFFDFCSVVYRGLYGLECLLPFFFFLLIPWSVNWLFNRSNLLLIVLVKTELRDLGLNWFEWISLKASRLTCICLRSWQSCLGWSLWSFVPA